MRPPADSTKEFTDPSVCPTYMYKGDLFPPFLSGSGYILPQAVIPCLYEQTRRLPFLHIDDVFVTGFCAEACGFMRWALIGTDPRAYKGPIVKGWPPGKSRDMNQIMVKNYIVEHCSNQDLSRVKLFIGVKTVATHFEACNTTRETWASFQHNHPDVKVMFFLGEVEDLQLLNHLKLEIQAHCDLVIVHGLDTYQNVTMKTQLGLNPVVSMIMDDDSYLNLQQLHHLISHRLLARPFDNALIGFIFGGEIHFGMQWELQ
ncbi:hypothetical protein TCAL_16109, partial [Tigriopus californicus]